MRQMHVGGLVGIPFSEKDCYQLARMALARDRIDLPENPADALTAREALFEEVPAGEMLRAYDVILLEFPREPGKQHVGVACDGFRFLHTRNGTADGTGGDSRVDRIADFEGYIVARLRARRPA